MLDARVGFALFMHMGAKDIISTIVVNSRRMPKIMMQTVVVRL